MEYRKLNQVIVLIVLNAICISAIVYLQVNIKKINTDQVLCSAGVDTHRSMTTDELTANYVGKHGIVNVTFTIFEKNVFLENGQHKAEVALYPTRLGGFNQIQDKLPVTQTDFPKGVPDGFTEWIVLSKVYREKLKVKKGDTLKLTYPQEPSNDQKSVSFDVKVKGFFESKQSDVGHCRHELIADLDSFAGNKLILRRKWQEKNKALKANIRSNKFLFFCFGKLNGSNIQSEHKRLKFLSSYNSGPHNLYGFLNSSKTNAAIEYYNPSYTQSVKDIRQKAGELSAGRYFVLPWAEPVPIMVNGEQMLAIPFDVESPKRLSLHPSINIKLEGKIHPLKLTRESFDENKILIVGSKDANHQSEYLIKLPGQSATYHAKNAVKGTVFNSHDEQYRLALLSYDLFFGIKGVLHETHQYDSKLNIFYKLAPNDLRFSWVRFTTNNIQASSELFKSLTNVEFRYHNIEECVDLLVHINRLRNSIWILWLIIVVTNLYIVIPRFTSMRRLKKGVNHEIH